MHTSGLNSDLYPSETPPHFQEFAQEDTYDQTTSNPQYTPVPLPHKKLPKKEALKERCLQGLKNDQKRKIQKTKKKPKAKDVVERLELRRIDHQNRLLKGISPTLSFNNPKI